MKAGAGTPVVADLGEAALIGLIRRWLGPAAPPSPFGPGDDCAVLPLPRATRLLVTTDPVIAGRHFDDRTPAAAAGSKLLRRNLSDIAAMGGTPLAAVVSCTLPPDLPVSWLRGFYAGLRRAALRYGVTVVGGDLSGAPGPFSAHLTLLGRAPRRALARGGARAGDILAVTGPLGGSILGRHLRFEPRLAEGAWLAARASVHALMDLSDGLAKDLPELVPPGHAACVDADALPVSNAARQMALRTGRDARAHAAADGEDYELLLAAAPGPAWARLAAAWKRRFVRPLHPIGRIERAARGAPPVHGSAPGLDWSTLRGYEHLRPT